ncbi:hypothetical protein KGF57_002902 [Candida theae]|uniref:SCP domain-containing protein n=1 Tax=Candida theae TaxID=1198502 RepID=A0AAD5FYD8_9ASCO|nr:uncharacterized protein KGF57_002902 [Candida theae]KAI5958094.1 hypothetical protein KGF57_002902 [Candida theae]
MFCKLQVTLLFVLIAAVVHSATILVTDVVYVTVQRSAIYNESGVYYTEYPVGNPSPTAISTTTDVALATMANTVEVVQSIEASTLQSSSTSASILSTKASTTSTRAVVTTSATPTTPPPVPVTTKISSSIVAPAPATHVQAQRKPSTLTTKASPSTPTPQVASAEPSFQNEILSAHNAKRAAHGVAALSWSQELYNYAQKVANAYDCSGNLKHTFAPYGENLGVGYSSAQSVVNAWYSEGKNYNYQLATTFDHFTQVVWKSTTLLGCAYKDCSSRGWGMYVICNYKEVGNMRGKGKQNVLPLI